MVFILYTTAICVGLIALFKWLWTRRKFYYLSWQLPGPVALPLIGNFLEAIDHKGKLSFNITHFLCIIMEIRVGLTKLNVMEKIMFSYRVMMSFYRNYRVES